MSEKKRILCLHGYRQSDLIFRQRTGALRKILKNQAEFVFIAAPNKIENVEKEGLGWWFSKEDKSYNAHDVTDCDLGFNESLEVVANALAEQGPFDGILAFSQGSALLSIICALKENKDTRFENFKFAIFVAGFKSQQTTHQIYYETQINIPSLHVIGEDDKVIEKAMSEDLLKLYKNKVVLNHKGGHFVPATSAEKTVYINFLKNVSV